MRETRKLTLFDGGAEFSRRLRRDAAGFKRRLNDLDRMVRRRNPQLVADISPEGPGPLAVELFLLLLMEELLRLLEPPLRHLPRLAIPEPRSEIGRASCRERV